MRMGQIEMKEKIEVKIESIIDYIISKPDNEITLDDYTILASEVRDIRFREADSASKARMEQLMASAFPAFSCATKSKEVLDNED